MEDAGKWFEQARQDYAVALHLLSSEFYWAAAFHSQQSVEKALKALLYKHGRVLWSHDLVELGEEIQKQTGLDLSPIMEDLEKLTVHYTISRYPDAANAAPSKIYTRKTAEELIEGARRVLEWVEQNLRS